MDGGPFDEAQGRRRTMVETLRWSVCRATSTYLRNEHGVKFEKSEVWQQSLDYIDVVYELADEVPSNEQFNMRSQITRAATSINLNIAEGSTGQTDDEQARFLGLAIRSLIETVSCQHIIYRRKWLNDTALLRKAYSDASSLAARLQTFRKAIAPNQKWLREEEIEYIIDGEPPWMH